LNAGVEHRSFGSASTASILLSTTNSISGSVKMAPSFQNFDGTRPAGLNFPARNRLTAVCPGVVVVEATEKSALCHAALALEQAGSLASRRAARVQPRRAPLIRQGAKLVETVDDILKRSRTQLVRSGKA